VLPSPASARPAWPKSLAAPVAPCRNLIALRPLPVTPPFAERVPLFRRRRLPRCHPATAGGDSFEHRRGRCVTTRGDSPGDRLGHEWLDRFVHPIAEAAHRQMVEPDRHQPSLSSKPNRVASKRGRHVDVQHVVAKEAALIDDAELTIVGPAARAKNWPLSARPIHLARRLHSQRLMRPHVIELGPPGIADSLLLLERRSRQCLNLASDVCVHSLMASVIL